MKLNLQLLANLCMYAWELRREVGFHMQNPETFRKHIAAMKGPELQAFMENLGLLFREIDDLGQTEVELTANGHSSLWAPIVRPQTAKAIGSPESIINIQEVPEAKPVG